MGGPLGGICRGIGGFEQELTVDLASPKCTSRCADFPDRAVHFWYKWYNIWNPLQVSSALPCCYLAVTLLKARLSWKMQIHNRDKWILSKDKEKGSGCFLYWMWTRTVNLAISCYGTRVGHYLFHRLSSSVVIWFTIYIYHLHYVFQEYLLLYGSVTTSPFAFLSSLTMNAYLLRWLLILPWPSSMFHNLVHAQTAIV